MSVQVGVSLLSEISVESFQFLCLLGLLPVGFNGQQLEELWGDDWDTHVDRLEELNFINLHSDKVVLTDCMISYMQKAIPNQYKDQFKGKVIQYYLNFLSHFITSNLYSESKEKRESLPEYLNIEQPSPIKKQDDTGFFFIEKAIQREKNKTKLNPIQHAASQNCIENADRKRLNTITMKQSQMNAIYKCMCLSEKLQLETLNIESCLRLFPVFENQKSLQSNKVIKPLSYQQSDSVVNSACDSEDEDADESENIQFDERD